MTTAIQQAMLEKVKSTIGFIAALDQSGGSTPKALKLYGIDESGYSNDEEMFSCVHAMRARIVTSPSFDGKRVLGAILFEDTLDREVEGVSSARYLWNNKNVVPFLKVDKGLCDEENGVQLMKSIPDLAGLLSKANAQDVFGTKMRSVVKMANKAGVDAIVAQQFEIGKQILAAGLMPIIEPEVDINSPEKAAAEALLKAAILTELDALDSSEMVMLKLTLPEQADFYADLVAHPKVLKVVALSGGYDRNEANKRLSSNKGMIASFSRALTQSLSAQQSDVDFNTELDNTIQDIYDASAT